MKILLAFPPQWTPISPHYSMTSLISQLKNAGYDAKTRDLNIEFFNSILTEDYLNEIIKKIPEEEKQALKELTKEYETKKEQSDYSNNFQYNLYKYTKIKSFKDNRINELTVIPSEINESVRVLKSEDFYNPQKLIKAFNVIDNALEIISLPFLPSEISFCNYSNRFLKLTFESIKEFCLDKKTNMFYEFYENIVKEIVLESNDLIAISINSNSQIIPGLTLAMLLKEKSSAHISIGGNFFSRVIEGFKTCEEFFEIFAHSVMYEEGEIPIVKLADYIAGKIPVEEVCNLVYLGKEGVEINPKITPLLLNDTIIQDLDDFELNQYFVPEIVLPVMSSRGCYWRKCTFCDQDFGQNFNVKTTDLLIEQMETFKNKYNIDCFEFIDESVHPDYLKELSEKLLAKGLKVNWFMNARLEKEFSIDLLKLSKEAGLKMMLWGVESGSKKVMQHINKGIDIENRMHILKNAHDSEIWNFAYIFFGFPTETEEDAKMTIDMIVENKDIISSYGRSVFALGNHSKLKDCPEKFGISRIYHNGEEFSPTYFYETINGMNTSCINKVAELCTEVCNNAYGNPLWMHLRYREVLFLYIVKYGAAQIENSKITEN